MKIILSSFSIFLSLFFLAQAEKFRVVIDPGHGGAFVKGKNDGTQESHGVSYNNASVKLKGGVTVYEKDIVLDYAKSLKLWLEKYQDMEVTLTRSDDSSPSAMTRAAVAVDKQADIYLSLHFNSGGGKGPRAYVVAEDHKKWEYMHFTNPYIKRDITLAKDLVKALETAFKPFGGKPSATKVFNDTHSPTKDHGLGKGNLKDGIRTIGYARQDTHLFNAAIVLLEIEFLDTKNYSAFLHGKSKAKTMEHASAHMAKAIDEYRKKRVKLKKPRKARSN